MIGAETEKSVLTLRAIKVFQSFYVALNSVQKSRKVV